VLGLARRHIVRRQIGQTCEQSTQRLLRFGSTLLQLLCFFPQSARLLHYNRGILTSTLQPPDFFAQRIAPRLQQLRLGDARTPQRVEFLKVTQRGRRVHPARAKFFLYQGEVAPNEGQIKHLYYSKGKRRKCILSGQFADGVPMHSRFAQRPRPPEFPDAPGAEAKGKEEQ
jgi:hypothetical protein